MPAFKRATLLATLEIRKKVPRNFGSSSELLNYPCGQDQRSFPCEYRSDAPGVKPLRNTDHVCLPPRCKRDNSLPLNSRQWSVFRSSAGKHKHAVPDLIIDVLARHWCPKTEPCLPGLSQPCISWLDLLVQRN